MGTTATETSIIVRKGKAYVSYRAGVGKRGYYGIQPLYEIELTPSDMGKGLERVFKAGDPWAEIDRPVREKTPVSQFPVVKTWTVPVEASVWYNIAWRPDGPILYASKTDKKGGIKDDPGRTRRFPPGTTMEQIARAIIDDFAGRPKL